MTAQKYFIFSEFFGDTNTIKQEQVFVLGVRSLKTMAQLYLVAFKENNNGTEPEENYALRELLDEHCSYCIPAGTTSRDGWLSVLKN